MIEHCVIYLSGSVKKGTNDKRDLSYFWADDQEQYILANVKARKVILLNPSKTKIDRADFLAHFGCDLHQISISDIMLVDFRKEKGIGIGAEMMFAQQNGIPVISFCPKNTNYRRNLTNFIGQDIADWIHPFVFGLSNAICSTLEECVEEINHILSKNNNGDKDMINKAIKHYNRVRETW